MKSRTPSAGVVDQNDLVQHGLRRTIDNAVDGSQQRGPGLVVEDDYHGAGRKPVDVDLFQPAPVKKKNTTVGRGFEWRVRRPRPFREDVFYEIVTIFYGRPAATCSTVSGRWPSG